MASTTQSPGNMAISEACVSSQGGAGLAFGGLAGMGHKAMLRTMSPQGGECTCQTTRPSALPYPNPDPRCDPSADHHHFLCTSAYAAQTGALRCPDMYPHVDPCASRPPRRRPWPTPPGVPLGECMAGRVRSILTRGTRHGAPPRVRVRVMVRVRVRVRVRGPKR